MKKLWKITSIYCMASVRILMKNEIISLAQETGTSINFWLQVKRNTNTVTLAFERYCVGVFRSVVRTFARRFSSKTMKTNKNKWPEKYCFYWVCCFGCSHFDINEWQAHATLLNIRWMGPKRRPNIYIQNTKWPFLVWTCGQTLLAQFIHS